MLKMTLLISALAACATTDTSTTAQLESSRDCPAGVPASLAPPANETLAFTLAATGVQKYECRATATGFAWTFIAPDAQLFREEGKRSVGHHYAGPTWEYKDGSLVVGAKVAAAAVTPGAIPWLLLRAVSHGTVDGKLSDVTSIQRLQTTGGSAPATGCDADHLGAALDVAYTAVYFFYQLAEPDEDDAPVRCGA